MTWRDLAILMGALALVPATGDAQDARPGVAVLPFANGGSYGQDKEDFEGLERGIAALVTSELGRSSGARVVARSESQRALDQHAPANASRIDAATAVKVAKAVGARYVIAGTFLDYYGNFRVDARIVDAESGEILAVAKAGPGDRQTLFSLIQSLVRDITKRTSLAPPPPPPPADQAASARTVPTDALTAYGKALLYQDRGDTTRAAELYQRALEAYPEFAEAKEGLRTIRG